MSSRLVFCPCCQKPVQPVKNTSAGFWIVALLTGGVWLFTYPFKKRNRCPICKCKI